MNEREFYATAGGDPEIARLVQHAYQASVDVETASRHLWRLHQVAGERGARGARRMLVSALAAVLLFATTGGAVVLSGDSVPGDSLYVVKRGAERMHLLVSFAPESDARLHLRFARSRVDEVRRVAGSRPAAIPALLTDVVAAIDRAEAAGQEAMADEVDVVRREASTTLSALGATADAEVAAHLDDTVSLLADEVVVTGRPTPESQPEPLAADGGGSASGADSERARAAAGVDGHLATPRPLWRGGAGDPEAVPPDIESPADVTAPAEPPAADHGTTEPAHAPSGPPPSGADSAGDEQSMAALGRLEVLVLDL